jgi:leader peptidase (prepilin peptidase)/N-methyltransferase
MTYILFGLLGLLAGSTLNLAIDRLTPTEAPRPLAFRCPACGARRPALGSVPVLGYIIFRGRCPACGARASLRALWVELATGFIWALLWGIPGLLPLRRVLLTAYASILLVILVIDLERRLVPNVIVLPAIGLAALAVPLELLVKPVPFGHYGLLYVLLRMAGGPALPPPLLGVISLILGGVIAFVIFLVIWLIAPQGMGAGDVKLAAFVGLITGFPVAIAAICGAFLVSGLVALGLLLSRWAGRKSTIPFAPFLAVATVLALIWGDRLLLWYLGM